MTQYILDWPMNVRICICVMVYINIHEKQMCDFQKSLDFLLTIVSLSSVHSIYGNI